VFLAAHSPGTRAAAMEEAYRRWGIGLSLFRGPTFPLVRAPPAWQLLFKAGDQELYQRLDAPNAALNMERARSWLAARAPQPGTDLTQLALQVGAQRWLRAPYQIHRGHKARELLRSGLAEDVQRGLSLQAELLFDAGHYAQALPLLERLLARAPGDTKAAYKALLAALGSADEPAVVRWLPVLQQRRAQLSGPQRDRLRAIEQASAAR
jgi:tetratricopeptide (TPR) repeat protein